MLVTCWSVKGGSGTTVVAAALAVGLAPSGRVLAVDLAGDLTAVLACQGPAGPGVLDWVHAAAGVGPAALDALAVDAGPGLRLLHRGEPDPARPPRWAELADALREPSYDAVVVDAGLAPLPPPLAAACDESLLVLRPCYLALRRVPAAPERPTGVVLVTNPGRALGRGEVERVVGTKVVGQLPVDPAVARAVDAGLLLGRQLPPALRAMTRQVRHAFELSARIGAGGRP